MFPELLNINMDTVKIWAQKGNSNLAYGIIL